MNKLYRLSRRMLDWLFPCIVFGYLLLQFYMNRFSTGVVTILSALWLICFLISFVSTFTFLYLDGRMREKYSLFRFADKKFNLTIGELNSDSPLYQSGLRPGDIVLGVNGKNLESDSPLSDWWVSQDSISLDVLRGNENIRIEVKKE